MYLENYCLSIPADSKEQALEKIEENLEEEDMDFVKFKTNPNLTETEFNSKDARMRLVTSQKNQVWNSIELVFTASEQDRNLGKKIFETLSGSLEEQAKSFKPDDRGRITLGSNYSEENEVQVIVLDD